MECDKLGYVPDQSAIRGPSTDLGPVTWQFPDPSPVPEAVTWPFRTHHPSGGCLQSRNPLPSCPWSRSKTRQPFGGCLSTRDPSPGRFRTRHPSGGHLQSQDPFPSRPQFCSKTRQPSGSRLHWDPSPNHPWCRSQFPSNPGSIGFPGSSPLVLSE